MKKGKKEWDWKDFKWDYERDWPDDGD